MTSSILLFVLLWFSATNCVGQRHHRGTSCAISYIPSPLETRWVNNIDAWATTEKYWAPGCAAWREDKEKWDVWLSYLHNWTNAQQTLPTDIFSVHKLQCANKSAVELYIEPLAAALRHPYFWCHSKPPSGFLQTRRSHRMKVHAFMRKFLFDTSWISIPFADLVPHRQAYFSDLGSTLYDSGVAGYQDSLAWFMDSYRTRGWNFSHIYAWEARLIDQTKYWDHVPESMKSRLHFRNVPCNSDAESMDNPLNVILAKCVKEDYVVFKLDIDTNALEVELIMQIISSPKLKSLIDEIFWENHVTHHPLHNRAWGSLDNVTGPSATLPQSYKVFSQLRHAGIRAHSWV